MGRIDPDPIGSNEPRQGRPRQEATLRLALTSDGFGGPGRQVRVVPPNPGASVRVPFRLGPFEGEAILADAVDVTLRGGSGAVETRWDLVLVPSGDWTPVDLLVAFGGAAEDTT